MSAENKEELRKKYNEFIIEKTGIGMSDYDADLLFDFFYSEIEEREKLLKQKTKDIGIVFNASVKVHADKNDLLAKLSQAEELLRLAERVIDAANSRNWLIYVDALEKYESIKNKP